MNTTPASLEEISNQIIAERILGIFKNYIVFNQFDMETRILPGEFKQIGDLSPQSDKYIKKYINDMVECSVYTYYFYVRQETDTKYSYIGFIKRKREPEIKEHNKPSNDHGDGVIENTYSSF